MADLLKALVALYGLGVVLAIAIVGIHLIGAVACIAILSVRTSARDRAAQPKGGTPT